MLGTDALVRYGYTLADVHRLARMSAAANRIMAADHRDLIDTAWGGIVDALFAAERAPTEHDLLIEGKAAIWSLTRDHRTTYGYRDREWDAGLGSAPHFVRYWHNPVDHGPEERTVERNAVIQIFAAISDRDRRVLLAAATFDGDYPAAAAALDMPAASYRTYLTQARRACAALWHQGETPRRGAGTFNRRRHRGEVAPCGTVTAGLRHRRRKEQQCPACAPVMTAYERDRKQQTKANRAEVSS